MCQFQINKQDFLNKFGIEFRTYFAQEEEHIQNCIEDGLIKENTDQIQVTDLGKIFIRNVCMGFDWYLKQTDSHKRFSKTV